jgi:hypothetical protein
VVVATAKSVKETALMGSSVRSLEVEDWSGSLDAALRAMVPPSTIWRPMTWGESGGPDLTVLTRLSVTGGLRSIPSASRRFLLEVDLSALDALPDAFTLGGCLFLERVRLPLALERLPNEFFCCCDSLSWVNLAECCQLAVIGDGAFLGCLSLSEMVIPSACSEASLRGCGVRRLDLRYCVASWIDIKRCGRLEELRLPRRFVSLEGSLNAMLTRVTMGDLPPGEDPDVFDWVRLAYVRYMASSCQWFWGIDVGFADASVFGEVGAVGGRCTCPALPA